MNGQDVFVGAVSIVIGALAIIAMFTNMHAAFAVMRRNFVGYFSNPTGYVFLCLFVLLTSIAAFCPHAFFAANLANLAQCLLGLIDPDQDTAVALAQQTVDTFPERFLKAHEAGMQRKLGLLTGLRGGSEAVNMFVTIDRALQGDDVWFTDWEFQRAGSTVENTPETTTNGYFIVIPAADGQDSNEAWKIETHMTFNGQARDHSALSGFVRRLYRQKEIQDVRILDTSRRGGNNVVDFRLAVTVDSAGGDA